MGNGGGGGGGQVLWGLEIAATASGKTVTELTLALRDEEPYKNC